MTRTAQCVLAVAFALAMAVSGRATGQVPAASSPPPQRAQSAPTLPDSITQQNLRVGSPSSVTPSAAETSQPLFNFKDSDIKFNLTSLMSVLRDSRHEGWVLAAYPDPKTSRPLIGAGFGLDVPATEHPQRDPLNPHLFLEPSTGQLWQAAGLDSARLQAILEQFDHDLAAWKKKNFRKKIRTHALSPQITEQDAAQLLRISAIQATYNARAYCRFFDQLTASQQMALSQLVFQMGVNLEEFTQFLAAINDDAGYRDSLQVISTTEPATEHWKMVQTTLIQSQWARRYRTRAISVIAMFDPSYAQDPRAAERKVQATLRPPASHRRKKSHAASVRAGSDATHGGQVVNGGAPRTHTGKS